MAGQKRSFDQYSPEQQEPSFAEDLNQPTGNNGSSYQTSQMSVQTPLTPEQKLQRAILYQQHRAMHAQKRQRMQSNTPDPSPQTPPQTQLKTRPPPHGNGNIHQAPNRPGFVQVNPAQLEQLASMRHATNASQNSTPHMQPQRAYSVDQSRNQHVVQSPSQPMNHPSSGPQTPVRSKTSPIHGTPQQPATPSIQQFLKDVANDPKYVQYLPMLRSRASQSAASPGAARPATPQPQPATTQSTPVFAHTAARQYQTGVGSHSNSVAETRLPTASPQLMVGGKALTPAALQNAARSAQHTASPYNAGPATVSPHQLMYSGAIQNTGSGQSSRITTPRPNEQMPSVGRDSEKQHPFTHQDPVFATNPSGQDDFTTLPWNSDWTTSEFDPSQTLWPQSENDQTLLQTGDQLFPSNSQVEAQPVTYDHTTAAKPLDFDAFNSIDWNSLPGSAMASNVPQPPSAPLIPQRQNFDNLQNPALSTAASFTHHQQLSQAQYQHAAAPQVRSQPRLSTQYRQQKHVPTAPATNLPRTSGKQTTIDDVLSVFSKPSQHGNVPGPRRLPPMSLKDAANAFLYANELTDQNGQVYKRTATKPISRPSQAQQRVTGHSQQSMVAQRPEAKVPQSPMPRGRGSNVEPIHKEVIAKVVAEQRAQSRAQANNKRERQSTSESQEPTPKRVHMQPEHYNNQQANQVRAELMASNFPQQKPVEALRGDRIDLTKNISPRSTMANSIPANAVRTINTPTTQKPLPQQRPAGSQQAAELSPHTKQTQHQSREESRFSENPVNATTEKQYTVADKQATYEHFLMEAFQHNPTAMPSKHHIPSKLNHLAEFPSRKNRNGRVQGYQVNGPLLDMPADTTEFTDFTNYTGLTCNPLSTLIQNEARSIEEKENNNVVATVDSSALPADNVGSLTTGTVAMSSTPAAAPLSPPVPSAPELPLAAEEPAASEAPSAPELPQAFEAPGAPLSPPVPSAPELPQAAEAPATPLSPPAPSAFEAPTATEAPVEPEASPALQALEASEALEDPKATPAPELPQASEAREAPPEREAFEAPEAPALSETPARIEGAIYHEDGRVFVPFTFEELFEQTNAPTEEVMHEGQGLVFDTTNDLFSDDEDDSYKTRDPFLWEDDSYLDDPEGDAQLGLG